MNKSTIFLVGLVIILFAGIFLWISNRNQSLTDLERAYINLPVEQSEKERTWREIEFEQIAFNPELLNPISLITDMDGYFLVSDFGYMKIKKFDSQARLIEEYGEGVGRGPGEASNIMDIQVDSRNRVWITDNRNSRITVFGSSEYWEIIEPEEAPARVLPIDDNQYMIEPRFSSTPEMRNNDGTLMTSFQNLVDEPRLWTNVLDSFYAKGSNNKIIRVFLNTNNFAQYNADGEIKYFRRPIEAPELPAILPPQRYSEDQTYFFNEIDRNAINQITIGIDVIGNQIHLLVRQPGNNRLMDVYRVDTGDYIYSYELPEDITAVAISETHFAGLVRDSIGISIWKVNTEW